MNVDFLKEKGRTEIAKAAGVSVNTARYWIEGKTAMKVDDALRIARYFSVPIQDVVGVEYDNSAVVIAALDAENRMLQEKIRMILSVLGVQKSDGEN
jgi:transcriptional regulator with XRE-family HTH domain